MCETVRTVDGPRQRTLCYLGELNGTTEARWRKTIQVFNAQGEERQLALFPAGEALPGGDAGVVPIRLERTSWERPRQLGNVLLGLTLWRRLELDRFWAERLDRERAAIPWSTLAAVLAINRLCEPGSELAIARRWVARTALDDLLGFDERRVTKDRLYRCLDRLLAHKAALEHHLTDRYGALFGATFDVLLYDLTSTYFEGLGAAIPLARRGYSRDHRPDCKQVLIALVVTPEGFPLSYEVLAGNRQDHGTLLDMLGVVERKYGRARRVWIFDRGVVSEENLEALRARGMPYVVGTPRSHLKRVEAELLAGGWKRVRDEVRVKLAPVPGSGGETYVLCKSRGRQAKERAMRELACRRLEGGLTKLVALVAVGRVKDERIIQRRIGAALARHPSVARLYRVEVVRRSGRRQVVWQKRPDRWRRALLQEGTYLLRAHGMDGTEPERLWEMYVQLTEAEAAFRAFKSDLLVRPIWHQTGPRVEAHIMVAFLGYAQWVALKHTLRGSHSELSPGQALELLAMIQSGDLLLETVTGEILRLRRVSRPDAAQRQLLSELRMELPERLGADRQM